MWKKRSDTTDCSGKFGIFLAKLAFLGSRAQPFWTDQQRLRESATLSYHTKYLKTIWGDWPKVHFGKNFIVALVVWRKKKEKRKCGNSRATLMWTLFPQWIELQPSEAQLQYVLGGFVPISVRRQHTEIHPRLATRVPVDAFGTVFRAFDRFAPSAT